jgi:hypothetical protein
MLLVILSFYGCPDPHTRDSREPREAALRKVKEFHASRMGVDHAQNLWAWDALQGAVHALSPQGELTTERIGAAMTVDADREWGVVGLYFDGHELRVSTFGGGSGRALKLESHAAGVCWIDSDLVAVAPSTALHRVEVWSLAKQALVATLGDDNEESLRGRSKVVFLDYDAKQKLLYALEAYTGELQVYSAEWKLVRATRVLHPKMASYEAFVRDHIAKVGNSAGSDLLAVNTWDGFTTDAKGDVWMVQEYEYPGTVTTVVKVSPRTTQITPVPNVECGSKRLVVWGSWLVSYRDPRNPRQGCVSVGRLS